MRGGTLDQVWSILRALELLPLDWSRRTFMTMTAPRGMTCQG